MSIDEMEEYGVSDYYLELKKFINEFINKNYSLTKEDMRAILEGKTTLNIESRRNTENTLLNSMNIALQELINNNEKFLDKLQSGENVKPIYQQLQNEIIFNIKQKMLEDLWNYNEAKANDIKLKKCI